MNANPPNPYLSGDAQAVLASAHGDAYANAGGPPLEDTSPVLRQSESQRVNRKALMFLAGIIGLLVLMAMWMFARATSNDAGKAIKPPSEVVKIPELPQDAAAQPVPIAAQAYDTTAPYPADPVPLPPLPSEPAPMPSYAGPPPPHDMPPQPQAPRELTLMQRRMGEMADNAKPSPQELYTQAMLASMQGGNTSSAKADPAPAVGMRDGARYIANPDALLVRGTYIRCVLETRIVTDIEGFTSCIVAEPVYSINGRRLLLPKGSKVLGRYEEGHDGARVHVVWDRVTTPNGIDMTMSSPGVDGLGSAGHPGHYNAHWPSRIATALLISLIADGFEYAAAKNGPRTTYTNGDVIVESPFESKTSESLERVAQQAIAAGGRRKPTVTINQGTVVNVYVAKDIDFSNVVARR